MSIDCCSAGSILILVLRADHLPVFIVVAALVAIVAIGAIRAGRGRCADGSSTIAPARPIVASAVAGIAGDRAARAPRNRSTGIARTPCNRSATWTAGNAISSTMNPSTTYMHATAAHSAAVKTASATAEAAASSTAGIGVIRNQADCNENQSRQSGEDTTKHGVSSLTDDFASREAATISARELDVDQRNAAGRAFDKVRQLSSITPGTICTLLPKHLA